MLNTILIDSGSREHLLPFTATRPEGELRVGIYNIREKWERLLHRRVSYITQPYLQGKFPLHLEEDNLIINGSLLPTAKLAEWFDNLRPNEALVQEGELIAVRLGQERIEELSEDIDFLERNSRAPEHPELLKRVTRLWDLTLLAAEAFTEDFHLLTSGRDSWPISPTNRIIGSPGAIFLEEGAQLECCVINTTEGPVYLGKNSTVMEGSLLRGPLSVGRDSVIKMGAKIYGPTVIGPGCKAGGEITRSVMMEYANKAHDGYLGDAVLGAWTNIGADTNNSNLKNNYSEVKVWDYATGRFEKSGRQFVGLMLGDHSKCGINTMFNTGTVVGVGANVFGSGYLRNFIPDFSWGGNDSGYRTHRLEEAVQTAKVVMSRRGLPFSDADWDIFSTIFRQTATLRSWEK
jgi:UDP-N-acetylglucosamine diphosphorylase/glucosamine-1-phosphate N-acetyltransferase